MSDNIKLIMENWRRVLNEEPSMEYQKTPRQEYPEVAALIDTMNQNPRGYRFVDGSQVDPSKPVANEEDIFDKYASNWLDGSTMFKSLAEYERLLASAAYDDSYTKAEKELFTMFFQMSSDVVLNEQPQSNNINIKSQKESKQVNNNDMNLIMENFRKIKNSAKKLNMGQLSETLRLHENPIEREPMDSVRELEPKPRPIEREPLDSVRDIPLDEPPAGASEMLLAKSIKTAIEQHLADSGMPVEKITDDDIIKKAGEFLAIADGDGPGVEFLSRIPNHGLGNVTAQQITDLLRNHVAPAHELARLEDG